MKKFIFLLSCVLLLGISLAQAQVVPRMTFYHGAECPHCHKQHDWLPELEEMYPDLQIDIYEVWHDQENEKRFKAHMAELGHEARAVPTNVIEGEVITGFKPEEIVALLEKHYGPPVKPMDKGEEENTKQRSLWQRIMDWFRSLFGS